MNKTLKFTSSLIPLILSGQKTSTWRLFDDKDLTEGDIVDFLESGTNNHFATATITKTIEKPLGQLTAEDKQGHEKYRTDEDMYQSFQKYYNKSIGPETIVTIIWFKLL